MADELETSEPIPETDALSIDDYVANRREEREAPEKPEPEAKVDPETELNDTPDESADDEALATIDDQENEGEPEAPADDPETDNVSEKEEVKPEEQPTIDPPQFWKAEGKEHFASLDKVTQEYILHQDREANASYTKAMTEVADKVRTQTAEITDQYQGKLTHLEENLAILDVLNSDGYADDDQTLLLKMQRGEMDINQVKEYQVTRDARKELGEQLRTQINELRQQDFAQFVQTEQAKLPELVPDLVEKPERMKAVGEYLVNAGVSQEQLKGISAAELSMAYKAFQWDEAQTKAKEKPKRVPKPAAKVMKPNATKDGLTTNTQIAKLKAKYDKTGDPADFVRLQRARRKAA